MNNPLDNVPLNTQKAYVRGILPNGTKIYMPVDSRDNIVIQKAKEDLQAYLNTFPKPDPLVA